MDLKANELNTNALNGPSTPFSHSSEDIKFDLDINSFESNSNSNIELKNHSYYDLNDVRTRFSNLCEQLNIIAYMHFSIFSAFVHTKFGMPLISKYNKIVLQNISNFFIASTMKQLDLKDYTSTDIAKLALNAPPRQGKSLLATLIFPAWCLAINPSLKFVIFTNTLPLGNEHLRGIKQIMDMPFYRLFCRHHPRFISDLKNFPKPHVEQTSQIKSKDREKFDEDGNQRNINTNLDLNILEKAHTKSTKGDGSVDKGSTCNHKKKNVLSEDFQYCSDTLAHHLEHSQVVSKEDLDSLLYSLQSYKNINQDRSLDYNYIQDHNHIHHFHQDNQSQRHSDHKLVGYRTTHQESKQNQNRIDGDNLIEPSQIHPINLDHRQDSQSQQMGSQPLQSPHLFSTKIAHSSSNSKATSYHSKMTYTINNISQELYKYIKQCQEIINIKINSIKNCKYNLYNAEKTKLIHKIGHLCAKNFTKEEFSEMVSVFFLERAKMDAKMDARAEEDCNPIKNEAFKPNPNLNLNSSPKQRYKRKSDPNSRPSQPISSPINRGHQNPEHIYNNSYPSHQFNTNPRASDKPGSRNNNPSSSSFNTRMKPNKPRHPAKSLAPVEAFLKDFPNSNPFLSEEYQFSIIDRRCNKKNHIKTYCGGSIYTSSMRAGAIGFGADFIIIDDPHNPSDIHSQKNLDAAIQRFQTNIRTRINRTKDRRGGMLLTMQRLHEDDLTGALQKTHGFKYQGYPHMNSDESDFSSQVRININKNSDKNSTNENSNKTLESNESVQTTEIKDLSTNHKKSKTSQKTQNAWNLVKLPLIADEDMDFMFFNQKITIKAGEILNPSMTIEDVEALKTSLGPSVFQSQYQQESVSDLYGFLHNIPERNYHDLPEIKPPPKPLLHYPREAKKPRRSVLFDVIDLSNDYNINCKHGAREAREPRGVPGLLTFF
jgi:hypothetical protein